MKYILSGLSVVTMLILFSVTVSAQVQMADVFGVDSATGYPNSNVIVPVNITNVTSPIIAITFNVLYNNNVISLDSIQSGTLTATWETILLGVNKISIQASTLSRVKAIPNGSNGSVVLLNFSVKNVPPGTSSWINMSEINFADNTIPIPNDGFAPPKNGTFTVLTPQGQTITVSPATATLTVGATQEFTATANDANGNPIQGINISWTVGNSTVGGINRLYSITDVTGKAFTTFTANVAGTTLITATNGSKVGSASVTVRSPTNGVNLTVDASSKITFPNVNATYTLTVKNTGDSQDTYSLTLANLNNAGIASLSVTSVTLISGASTTVQLNVTNATSGTFNVSVTATSTNDVNIKSTINTTTGVVIANITGFTLDPAGNRAGWIYARVNISNSGGIQTFAIVVSGIDVNGKALVGTGTVELGAGVSKNNIPVIIYVPASALGNYNLIAGIWKIEDFAAPEKLITTSVNQASVVIS